MRPRPLTFESRARGRIALSDGASVGEGASVDLDLTLLGSRHTDVTRSQGGLQVAIWQRLVDEEYTHQNRPDPESDVTKEYTHQNRPDPVSDVTRLPDGVLFAHGCDQVSAGHARSLPRRRGCR